MDAGKQIGVNSMTTGSYYFKGFASIVLSLSLAISSGCATAAKSVSYADNPKAKLFVDNMVKQGFDRKEVEKLMANAKRQDFILKKISTPAERRLTWGEYRKIFLGEKRIQQGVQFWNTHADTLDSASKLSVWHQK
jgi:membrane-bound lytic murein transglycosylase B